MGETPSGFEPRSRHQKVWIIPRAGGVDCFAALPLVTRLPVQTLATGAVRFAVHLQPRASDTAIVGIHGDALKVRVHAPPVEGAANTALVQLLARLLGARVEDVRIVAGHTARRKVVEVRDASVEQVAQLAAR